MRFRRSTLGAVVVLLAVLTGACAGGDALQGGGGGDGGGGGGPIIVGSANFPEQLVLANMYAQVLEDAGVKTRTRLNLGSREVVFPALKSGEINLLPEYTGALLDFVAGESTVTEPDAVYEALQEELPDGLVALEPSEAQDKDGLAVLPETAEEHDLETYSDLEPVAGDMSVGGPPEMETREVGLPGLKRVYGIEFAKFVPLDTAGPVTWEALQSGDVDVARVFTTQGIIEARDWVLLEDDKDLAPAQEIVPVIAEDSLTSEVETALNEVSGVLTTEDLTDLNKQVEIDKRDPAAVARDYLKEQGLIEG
ncbi:MAG: ABC transporter substrate-binding protein [Actinomycetota bacterium]|nr:ABC transporter substrate-binding protein [Actinomycetota bacterium]